MTYDEQYKAWLEKEKGMRNTYNDFQKPEPGRVKPISVPDGVDYYERLIRDYLKDRQEINIRISDTIDHPPHYTSGKIEVWDFIADQGLDFFCGNVVKYICRAGRKGDKLEDLRKARAYVDKAIKNCGGE